MFHAFGQENLPIIRYIISITDKTERVISEIYETDNIQTDGRTICQVGIVHR